MGILLLLAWVNLPQSPAEAAPTDYEESDYIAESSEAGLSSYRFDSRGRSIPIGGKSQEKKFVPKAKEKRAKKSNALPGKRKPAGAVEAAKMPSEGGAEGSEEGAEQPAASSSAPGGGEDTANSAQGGSNGGVRVPPSSTSPGAVPSAGNGPPATPASGPATPSGGAPGGFGADSGGNLGDAQPQGDGP